MARNHYQDKDTQLIACATAQEHGRTWHDAETAQYRDMTLTSASPIDQWSKGACFHGRMIEVVPMIGTLKGTIDATLPDDKGVSVDFGLSATVEFWRFNGEWRNIVHSTATQSGAKIMSPELFPQAVAAMVAKIRESGKFAELSAMQRLGENGSIFTASILLGDLDLGGGDRGKCFLNVSTSVDGSEPSQCRVGFVREVCANTHAASMAEAERSGRKFSIRNYNGTSLEKLTPYISEAVDAALAIAHRQEVLTKALKGCELKFNSQGFFRMLKSAGEKSGALKRSKEQAGRIELTTDLVDALRGGSNDAVDLYNNYGSAGRGVIAAIMTRSSVETALGIADLQDTAFGAYAGITYHGTRRDENGTGPFAAMADEFAQICKQEYALTGF